MQQGTVLWMLFRSEPARFAFTESQRRLLLEAQQHKTDAGIAAACGISVSAVKKTWASIFERASELIDELPMEHAVDRSGTVRGVQKRHVLLTYLIAHPEELRPLPRFGVRHRKRGEPSALASKVRNKAVGF